MQLFWDQHRTLVMEEQNLQIFAFDQVHRYINHCIGLAEQKLYSSKLRTIYFLSNESLSSSIMSVF
jgi:hypothetical protein